MRRYPWIALLVCCVSALAGCRGDPSGKAPDGDAMVVRVYAVPPGRAEAITTALNNVMSVDGDHPPVGRASMVDGRIAVRAPSATQASVAKAIETLAEVDGASAAADATPLRLRFWFLRSAPGGNDADARLTELQPVLEQVRRSLGQSAFQLTDSAELRVSPGSEYGNITTDKTEIMARVMPARDGLMLSADIRTRPRPTGTGFRTDTLLKPGEFVVLNTASQDEAIGGGLQLVVVQALRDGKG